MFLAFLFKRRYVRHVYFLLSNLLSIAFLAKNRWALRRALWRALWRALGGHCGSLAKNRWALGGCGIQHAKSLAKGSAGACEGVKTCMSWVPRLQKPCSVGPRLLTRCHDSLPPPAKTMHLSAPPPKKGPVNFKLVTGNKLASLFPIQV